MRVLVAPASFGGPLTAVEAAAAIRTGWLRAAPHDTVEAVPMSDGGVGFVDVARSALGGDLVVTSVSGLSGDTVPATYLRTGSYAYVEAAQACGPHLVGKPPDPWAMSSYGVGELIAQAIDAGATRVIVGLGSVASLDAGAGVLAALGAQPVEALRDGPAALRSVAYVDVGPAIARAAGVEVLAATEVDNPLLGLRGVTNVHGVSRGVRPSDLILLDSALAHFADLVDAAGATKARAGAGGGIAYALGVLGGVTRPALDLLVELTGLAQKARRCDLVVTGTDKFGGASLRGAVVSAVADVTSPTGRPCVVLADEVEVGRREMNAYGIESAYAVADLVRRGAVAPASTPAAALAALAERVARSWSPAR